MGEHDQAVAAYHQALDAARETGRRFLEAAVLDHLGDVYAETGDVAAAVRSWRGTLTIMAELSMGDRDAVAEKLRRMESAR